MFNGCASLEEVPALDSSSCTSMRQTFFGCQSLRTLPPLNTALVTDMYGMLQNCSCLENIPWLDTSAATSATTFCQNNSALRTLPALDFAGVAGLLSNAFACSSLTECLITGITQTVSFASCKLSAAALNTIFTNLSANGAGKTITITGNYGAATCDTSIATAKGWTVTT
jgi:hypothetical protein